MEAVEEALELNLVKFQSGPGILVDGFVTILEFYLSFTLVGYEGKTSVQKRLRKGLTVAPVLAET